MPRKSGKSLSDNLNQIHRRYQRGSLVRKAIKGNFTERETALAKEAACLLSAAGFSEAYIAEALGTTRGVVNGWFKNDEALADRVLQIKDEITVSAVKLIRSYMLEGVEMLMEIARTTTDEKLAASVIQDLLDRGGVSKVNKSESVSAQTVREEKEVHITDKGGLVEALREASPEAQLAAAEHLEAFLAIAGEHTDESVTHGTS